MKKTVLFSLISLMASSSWALTCISKLPELREFAGKNPELLRALANRAISVGEPTLGSGVVVAVEKEGSEAHVYSASHVLRYSNFDFKEKSKQKHSTLELTEAFLMNLPGIYFRSQSRALTPAIPFDLTPAMSYENIPSEVDFTVAVIAEPINDDSEPLYSKMKELGGVEIAENIEVGETVILMGYPQVYGIPTDENGLACVIGKVLDVSEMLLRLEGEVLTGFSGGPVFNAKGNLLGIISRSGDGKTTAVNANHIQKEYSELKQRVF